MAMPSRSRRLLPRSHPRFLTEELKCRFRMMGDFRWYSGWLINVSRGGICLKALVLPPVGVQVDIEVELSVAESEGDTDKSGGSGSKGQRNSKASSTVKPKEEKVRRRRLLAEVRWRRGRRVGLKFLVRKSAPTKR